MPPDLRREVDDLLLLYALNGVADEPAARAIAELYSPPRVTVELRHMRRRCPGMGLVPGATFDLCEDEHGVAYDASASGCAGTSPSWWSARHRARTGASATCTPITRR